MKIKLSLQQESFISVKYIFVPFMSMNLRVNKQNQKLPEQLSRKLVGETKKSQTFFKPLEAF